MRMDGEVMRGATITLLAQAGLIHGVEDNLRQCLPYGTRWTKVDYSICNQDGSRRERDMASVSRINNGSQLISIQAEHVGSSR